MQPLQIGQNVRSYLNKRVNIKLLDPKILKPIFSIFQNLINPKRFIKLLSQSSLNVSVPNEGRKY